MDLRNDKNKYRCHRCRRWFSTIPNLEQHFWCLTPKELQQVINGNKVKREKKGRPRKPSDTF
jgi:hypothetical protein